MEQQNVRNGKRVFLRVIGILMAILLMVGISFGAAIVVHRSGGDVPAGTTVANGLSAYELAVQYGYEGTVQEWLSSL